MPVPRATLPVHLPNQNEDGSYEAGLSYDDHQRGHIETHKLFNGRDRAHPTWCLDLRKMGLLLARYMENRANIKPRIDTAEKRVVYAQKRILKIVPAMIARLDRLQEERLTLMAAGGDPNRIRGLEKAIRSLDGEIIVAQRGPSLIVGVIHFYFRCGYSSPETSAALKHMLSPQSVRQIAFRLERLWKKMQACEDWKPTKKEIKAAHSRAYYHMVYKPVQLADEKAARAAETPEQRAARLKWHRDYYHKHKAEISAQRKANQKLREKALLKYHSATDEEKAVRLERNREYNRTHREERLAAKRKIYARKLRAAVLTPEQREIRNARCREWCRTHKENRRAIRVRYLAKRKALAAARIEKRQDVLAESIAIQESRRQKVLDGMGAT